MRTQLSLNHKSFVKTHNATVTQADIFLAINKPLTHQDFTAIPSTVSEFVKIVTIKPKGVKSVVCGSSCHPPTKEAIHRLTPIRQEAVMVKKKKKSFDAAGGLQVTTGLKLFYHSI